MQQICNKYATNMQWPGHWPHKYFSYAFLCIYMLKICKKYAKICKHESYMQHMQKYALPTLLMFKFALSRFSPLNCSPGPATYDVSDSESSCGFPCRFVTTYIPARFATRFSPRQPWLRLRTFAVRPPLPGATGTIGLRFNYKVFGRARERCPI